MSIAPPAPCPGAGGATPAPSGRARLGPATGRVRLDPATGWAARTNRVPPSGELRRITVSAGSPRQNCS